jgi:type IV pilus assembly protein PilQ
MFRTVRCAVLALTLSAAVAATLAPVAVMAAGPDAGYKTRLISLDVQDAEIGTVLRSLAGYSGTNIVASPKVVGKVTVKLQDVPWLEALEVILRSHSFDYLEQDGIYRIDTAEALRQEKLESQRSRKQVEELEALHLGMIVLRYANAEEVKGALEKMLTERGSIDVDARTNSLLVNDVPSRVNLITAMAGQLDTQTPQVEINARVVDMDSRATRELGVNWSLANLSVPGKNIGGSMSIDNAMQNPSGDLRVATVQDWGELMVKVQALESDNRAQLISNPVITTTDNREAKILVGQKIPLIVADQAGNAITQLTTIGIQLRVTPHINSESRITLDIHNEVSDLSSQATVQGGVIINTSESDTRVLVENGATAIIAGLIRKIDSKLETGIPVLKSLPVLGALFRHSSDTKIDRELVIFVTPRIVTDVYMQRKAITEDSAVQYNPELGEARF